MKVLTVIPRDFIGPGSDGIPLFVREGDKIELSLESGTVTVRHNGIAYLHAPAVTLDCGIFEDGK